MLGSDILDISSKVPCQKIVINGVFYWFIAAETLEMLLTKIVSLFLFSLIWSQVDEHVNSTFALGF